MASGQQGHPVGRAIGFVVVLCVSAVLLAGLFDRASIAMGGHAVAMCALFPVIRDLAGSATGLLLFVAGLVLLALAGGRSRPGAVLLLAGTLLAAVPDFATAPLDPGKACAAPVTAPAPPASVAPTQNPLQPRAVLTPL